MENSRSQLTNKPRTHAFWYTVPSSFLCLMAHTQGLELLNVAIILKLLRMGGGSEGLFSFNILWRKSCSLVPLFFWAYEVQRIYCPLEVVTPLSIKVANEQKMTSSHEVIDFSWAMQGTTMTQSLRLLQNEGYDIILGCDWFKKHTPVTLDYDRMRVKIRIDGRRVRLQALKSIAICILLSHQSLYKLWHTHDWEDRGNVPDIS